MIDQAIFDEKLGVLLDRATRNKARATVLLYTVFGLGFLFGPALRVAGLAGLVTWGLFLLALALVGLGVLDRSRKIIQGVWALKRQSDPTSVRAGVIRAEYFDSRTNLWLGRLGK